MDMTKIERSERRKNVVSEILDGAGQSATAEKYSLSLSYVMTVLRSHCKKRNKELFDSIKLEYKIVQPDGSVTFYPSCVMISDIMKNSSSFR
jgi:hypothetical protein